MCRTKKIPGRNCACVPSHQGCQSQDSLYSCRFEHLHNWLKLKKKIMLIVTTKKCHAFLAMIKIKKNYDWMKTSSWEIEKIHRHIGKNLGKIVSKFLSDNKVPILTKRNPNREAQKASDNSSHGIIPQQICTIQTDKKYCTFDSSVKDLDHNLCWSFFFKYWRLKVTNDHTHWW